MTSPSLAIRHRVVESGSSTLMHLLNPGTDGRAHRNYPNLENTLPHIFGGHSRHMHHTRALALKRLRTAEGRDGSMEKNQIYLEQLKNRDACIFNAVQSSGKLEWALEGMKCFFEFEGAFRLENQPYGSRGERKKKVTTEEPISKERYDASIYKRMDKYKGKYSDIKSSSGWFPPTTIFNSISETRPLPMDEIRQALVDYTKSLEQLLPSDSPFNKSWKDRLSSIQKAANSLPKDGFHSPEEGVHAFAGIASKLADIDLSLRIRKQASQDGYTYARYETSSRGCDVINGFQGVNAHIPINGSLIIDATNHTEPSELIRSIGLAYWFSQAGFPIPAQEASLSFIPGIAAMIPSALETAEVLETGSKGAGFFVTSIKDTLKSIEKLPKGSLVCLDRIPRGSTPDALEKTEAALFGMLLDKGFRVVISSNTPDVISRVAETHFKNCETAKLSEPEGFDANSPSNIVDRLLSLSETEAPEPSRIASTISYIVDENIGGSTYASLRHRLSNLSNVALFSELLADASGLNTYGLEGERSSQSDVISPFNSRHRERGSGNYLYKTYISLYSELPEDFRTQGKEGITQLMEACNKLRDALKLWDQCRGDAAKPEKLLALREQFSDSFEDLKGVFLRFAEYYNSLVETDTDYRISTSHIENFSRHFEIFDIAFDETKRSAQPQAILRIAYDLLGDIRSTCQDMETALTLLDLPSGSNGTKFSTPQKALPEEGLIFEAAGIQPCTFSTPKTMLLIPNHKESKAAIPAVVRDDLVPVSLTVAEGEHFVVIHGPNSGGKTLLLKTLAHELASAAADIPTTGSIKLGEFDGIVPIFSHPDSNESSDSIFRKVTDLAREALEDNRSKRVVIMDELHGVDPKLIASVQLELAELAHRNGHYLILNTHTLDGIPEAQRMNKAVVWKMSGAPDYTLTRDLDPKPSSSGWEIAQTILPAEALKYAA